MGSRAVIELPPDLAARIEARVASGASSDPVEAIREGLEALESEDVRRLDTIRQRIAAALADPAPSVSADEAFDRVANYLKSLPRK
jgi:Arc/MetJ-type ribon-helix-helix transcriptional regulator